MIGFLDTLTLARTKLRSKKTLLIVTVILASLVFGVIIAGSIVVTGATNSAETYLKSSLGNRYLVEVNPVIPDAVSGFTSRNTVPSDSLKKTLLDIQDKYISDQEAISNQYGVTFDSDLVAPIIHPSPFGIKDDLGKLQQVINTESPVWQVYVTQKQKEWIKSTNNKLSDLKIVAGNYGGSDYYQNNYGSISYMNAQYLSSDKEDMSKYGQSPTNYNASNPAITSIRNSSYVFADQSILQRFILPENNKRKENVSAIPVVITTEEGVALFGQQLDIGDRPSSAAEQITWMKDLQNKLNGQTYRVCYRSAGQIELIRQTIEQNVAAETQTADNPYTPLKLTYNLPTSLCGSLIVNSDTRTATEKKTDANKEAYQKAINTYRPITSQLLTFQIVGVMSISPNNDSYSSVSAFVNGLLGVNYFYGAFIPNQMYGELPSSDQHKDVLKNYTNSAVGYTSQPFIDDGIGSTIVAFPSAKEAQDFIDKETCYTQDSSSCDKPWTSQVYGSNYLLIGDFTRLVNSMMGIALPIALVVAAIIIWITMTRVIIDSRRETAIFRALGAKRIDIMRIYISYSVIVSLLTVLCAVLLGIVGAYVVESMYGDQTTNYAKVAYGVFDKLEPFSFIGINVSINSLIIASIVIVSLVAVLPPLIRNVRRNPIRDIRDDN